MVHEIWKNTVKDMSTTAKRVHDMIYTSFNNTVFGMIYVHTTAARIQSSAWSTTAAKIHLRYFLRQQKDSTATIIH